MPSSRDESELIVAAQQEIGDAETVLRAGVFGPADARTAVVHGRGLCRVARPEQEGHLQMLRSYL